MDQQNSVNQNDSRHSALISNASAVRAVAQAVESTLGPRGLDCMLVDSVGDVTITNDGSAILTRMDANHPAAKIVIRAARSQDKETGDGTTTTAILISAILQEAVSRVSQGVPVSILAAGIRQAVMDACKFIKSTAVVCSGLDDPKLRQCVLVSARGDDEITNTVIEAAKLAGEELLKTPSFDLRDYAIVEDGVNTGAFRGLVIRKDRMNRRMPTSLNNLKCLVIDDALEPEQVANEALSTERGFNELLAQTEKFKKAIQGIINSQVGFVAVGKAVSDYAEQALTQAGCIVLRRVGARDLSYLAEHTGATMLKRHLLDGGSRLSDYTGTIESIEIDEKKELAIIRGGGGKPAVSILVGSKTREVAEERQRIVQDACGALQSALKTGVLPGGGAIEAAASAYLNQRRQDTGGMESYGYSCVADALLRPITLIVSNSGYNPLEKVDMVLKAQKDTGSGAWAVNCETGELADMTQLGVYDPAGVRIRAIEAAGEVAEAILRINTIVRKKLLDSQQETEKV